jgi:hypothetical protein
VLAVSEHGVLKEEERTMSRKNMKMDLIWPAMERDYRDGGPFQWVRELVQNSLEAEAKNISFEVLPLILLGRKNPVLKRIVLDDGRGMTQTELTSYFNKYSSGGKRIGKTDENFGIGAKASLLPWNRFGLIIVSKIKGHPAYAIWIDFGKGADGTEDFGARIHEDSGEEAFLAEHHKSLGIDLASLVKGDHGTTFLLLGDNPEQSTALTCDPANDEGYLDISNFIDRRYQTLCNINGEPVSVCVETCNADADLSLKGRFNKSQASTGWAVHYPKGFQHACELHQILSGSIIIDDFIVHYSASSRPIVAKSNYATTMGGCVAMLWRNERYHVKRDTAARRAWGLIGSNAKNVQITIVSPSESDGRDWWVEPSSGRNTLRFGGSRRGTQIPWEDYALTFVMNMPSDLRSFIEDGLPKMDEKDEKRAIRVAELFGKRFGAVRFVVDDEGTEKTNPIFGGSGNGGPPGPPPPPGPPSPPGPGDKEGMDEGPVPAKAKQKKGSLPETRWLTLKEAEEDDLDHMFGQGRLACYQPSAGSSPLGTVFIRKDDPVIEAQIDYWFNRSIGSNRLLVAESVRAVYGLHLCTAIAHIRGTFLRPPRRGGLPKADVFEKYLSPEALTVTAMGLWLADRRIADYLHSAGIQMLKAEAAE